MAAPDCPDGILALLSIDSGGGVTPVLSFRTGTFDGSRGVRNCSTKDSLKTANGAEKLSPGLRQDSISAELLYNPNDAEVKFLETAYATGAEFAVEWEMIGGEAGENRWSATGFLTTPGYVANNGESEMLNVTIQLSEATLGTIP